VHYVFKLRVVLVELDGTFSYTLYERSSLRYFRKMSIVSNVTGF